MVRWEPGARERLQAAALELFASRGFEQTTASAIAESVGLTERTFFRHFSDKREVLFYAQDRFLQTFVDGVENAPADAAPLEAIAAALGSVASLFPDDYRNYSRMRSAVIGQNPALHEREQHKMAILATSVAEALRSRGVDEPAATLAAQSGATVFAVAITQWTCEGEQRSLPEITEAVLDELRTVTAAPVSRREDSPARPRDHRP